MSATRQAGYNLDIETIEQLDRFINTVGDKYGINSRRTAIEAMIESLFVKLGGTISNRNYPDIPIDDLISFKKHRVTFPTEEKYNIMLRFIQKRMNVQTNTDIVEKTIKSLTEAKV